MSYIFIIVIVDEARKIVRTVRRDQIEVFK